MPCVATRLKRCGRSGRAAKRADARRGVSDHESHRCRRQARRQRPRDDRLHPQRDDLGAPLRAHRAHAADHDAERAEVVVAGFCFCKRDEFGDVLFSLINYARFVNINPENALAKTNTKFINRFKLMEELILKDNKGIENLNLSEMDVYWDQAKKQLRN